MRRTCHPHENTWCANMCTDRTAHAVRRMRCTPESERTTPLSSPTCVNGRTQRKNGVTKKWGAGEDLIFLERTSIISSNPTCATAGEQRHGGEGRGRGCKSREGRGGGWGRVPEGMSLSQRRHPQSLRGGGGVVRSSRATECRQAAGGAGGHSGPTSRQGGRRLSNGDWQACP